MHRVRCCKPSGPAPTMHIHAALVVVLIPSIVLLRCVAEEANEQLVIGGFASPSDSARLLAVLFIPCQTKLPAGCRAECTPPKRIFKPNSLEPVVGTTFLSLEHWTTVA